MTFITSYFFICGMMLFYNTLRDIKTRRVDLRFNFMAMGATIMLMSYLRPGFIHIILIAVGTAIITRLLSVAYAPGDITAFNWIFIGLGVIHPIFIIIFLLALLLFQVVTAATMWFLIKSMEKPPGYPTIIGAYLVTAILAAAML